MCLLPVHALYSWHLLYVQTLESLSYQELSPSVVDRRVGIQPHVPGRPSIASSEAREARDVIISRPSKPKERNNSRETPFEILTSGDRTSCRSAVVDDQDLLYMPFGGGRHQCLGRYTAITVVTPATFVVFAVLGTPAILILLGTPAILALRGNLPCVPSSAHSPQLPC